MVKKAYNKYFKRLRLVDGNKGTAIFGPRYQPKINSAIVS